VADNDVYIIAVKRDRRDEVPPDWCEVVRGTSGVVVMGASSPTRVQVRATSDAIEQITERLGAWLHVEAVVWHYPS
jgi:hypothetical protein